MTTEYTIIRNFLRDACLAGEHEGSVRDDSFDERFDLDPKGSVAAAMCDDSPEADTSVQPQRIVMGAAAGEPCGR